MAAPEAMAILTAAAPSRLGRIVLCGQGQQVTWSTALVPSPPAFRMAIASSVGTLSSSTLRRLASYRTSSITGKSP